MYTGINNSKNNCYIAIVILAVLLVFSSKVNAADSAITVTKALYATKVAPPSWNKSKKCTAPAIPQDKTELVEGACNNKTSVCSYTIPMPDAAYPDPLEGCYKDFQVEYTCAHDTKVTRKVEVGGVIDEAANQTIYLNCGDGGQGIIVDDASYGKNCNAALEGNRTLQVMTKCQGRDNCDYTVSAARDGDPAFGCGKTFVVEYQCNSDIGNVITVELPKEADNKTATLTCPSSVPSAINVTAVTMTYNTYWSTTNPKIFLDSSKVVITNNTGNTTSGGWTSLDVYAFDGASTTTMQKIGEVAVNLPVLTNGESYTYIPTPYQANGFSNMVKKGYPIPGQDYYIFIKVRDQVNKTGGYSSKKFRLPPSGM